jgi:hypothetical protein
VGGEGFDVVVRHLAKNFSPHACLLHSAGRVHREKQSLKAFLCVLCGKALFLLIQVLYKNREEVASVDAQLFSTIYVR